MDVILLDVISSRDDGVQSMAVAPAILLDKVTQRVKPAYVAMFWVTPEQFAQMGLKVVAWQVKEGHVAWTFWDYETYMPEEVVPEPEVEE